MMRMNTSPPLQMLEHRDTGAAIVTEFAIARGLEREAGLQLFEHIRRGVEVWLRNDLDDGGEGCTQFRYGVGGFQTAVFGHGWSSKWTGTDKNAILSAVVELADHNRGVHGADRGQLIREKTG
jgi:hypothetical protein